MRPGAALSRIAIAARHLPTGGCEHSVGPVGVEIAALAVQRGEHLARHLAFASDLVQFEFVHPAAGSVDCCE